MKQITYFFSLMLLAFAGWQCSASTAAATGTHIEGQLKGAENTNIFLDKIIFGKANEIVGKTESDASGQFSFNFETPVDAGIYNLRVGAQRIPIALDNKPANIKIDGDMATVTKFEFTAAGSRDTEILNAMGRKLASGQIKSIDAIKTFVDTTSSPLAATYIASAALGNQGLDIQKAAQAQMSKAYPSSPLTAAYATHLASVEQQAARQAAMSGGIQVGQPAPDIDLVSPDGKRYKLSDLKGQVVLLDFWASWCGPCRKENPNVVSVYNRYKDQGFTVYSVSLDGVDSRTMARLGDPSKADQMRESMKQRWVSAIKQDKLTWPYHVSDLKKWESDAAAMYGVRSIPRAFLIDRDGNIANTKVRGAEQIERELKKLL